MEAGRPGEAVPLLDLAVHLYPLDSVAQRHRTDALLAATPTSRKAIAALSRRAARDPDNFELQRQLDYALSKSRDYPKILKIWDRYLARHPDDGHALLERSGTDLSMDRRREGIDDARRACELGMGYACRRAQIALRKP